jgi:DNA end-binding protein Ku
MYLVIVRPHGEDGLILHQLHYADEIKAFSEVPIKDAPAPAARELALARQIIEQIASKDFTPAAYHDEVRERMQQLIDQKVEGKEIAVAPSAEPQAQVIDLMEALKQSLGMVGEGGGGKRAKAAPAAARASKAADDKPARRAGGSRGKR